MVHKGWQRQFRNTRRAPVTLLDSEVQHQASAIAFEPKENSTWRQQCQFLNSSKPGRNRDPDARRVIRRHVRNDTILRQKASPKVKPPKYRKLPDPQTVSEVGNTEDSEQDACTQCKVPSLFESPTALCIGRYAIEMQPRMHALLDRFVAYATSRMYPVDCFLSRNPFRSQHWFRTSLADPAMLHAMLYCTLRQRFWPSLRVGLRREIPFTTKLILFQLFKNELMIQRSRSTIPPWERFLA
jgi:hypothetical protein